MLPLMLSVVIAHFFNEFFNHETIYTKKLTRRGILIQLDKRIPIFKSMVVSDVLTSDFIYCTPQEIITDVLKKMHDKDLSLFPVIEDGEVKGTISYAELYRFKGPDSEKIETLFRRKNISVKPDINLYNTLDLMSSLKTAILVVKDENGILGFITRNRIIKSYLDKRGRL